jgi:hypothetical protein
VLAEQAGGLVPQRTVDEHSVDEDDGWAVRRTMLDVLNATVGELDLWHR